MSELTKGEFMASYRDMVKIRRVEETLMDVFSAGEIPGFIHVCIGQEATPVAVCKNLKESDCIATTHRGHGHALAKGIDLKLFMAELFGKKNGPCLGRSGSMHLAYKALGIMGANGIVGGGIPIATGAAFASKYKKNTDVIVCFFGEGSAGEGTFHESLNMASLWKLPIVYVCENNGWAEFTSQSVHMPIKDVADRAASYNMPGVVVPNDFLEIYAAAGDAVERARRGEGPTLLEVKSRRWHGHFVGDAQKYRAADDIEGARAQDCIARFENYLFSNNLLRPDEAAALDREIRDSVSQAIEFARNSPFPDPSELTEGLYA
ncbi:MAG: thiamine pyrophosphate-dependent dehydrogenase E1 component subunit alpha [Desulfobacteraceae bacterium]|nr:MAG: thiamine pyrophosphate-dependent dehydrogenase E1 component subunit alpha [Desulfobacteraceae bacterium]